MTGSRFVKYLSIAMAIFYMAFGFFIAFTNVLYSRIPYYRGVIGGVLLGYGIFRLGKLIYDIRKSLKEGKGFFDM
ncbi:MAG TPA: hypothetical protein VK177_19325 [Flavobacteriales bacterium]|nr:hypothetical protein [Flavobacteriales bacterium]